MSNDKTVGDIHTASAGENTSHSIKKGEAEPQVTLRDNGGAGKTDSTTDHNGASSGAPEIPQEEGMPAAQPQSPIATADPFDPMNLGISTDYAAAISAQASTKPVELRKPNDQEFFRTSPHPHQRLLVGGIQDKQDMSKLYVVQRSLLDDGRPGRDGCRARARPASEHRSGHPCCHPLIEHFSEDRRPGLSQREA
jgi:hypothetical protein